MLAGTLTNARQIRHRVTLVNQQVGPIDKNLENVALAGRTGRIAQQINLAAKDLSGDLNQVIDVAGKIDQKASSILTTARSINGVVTSINSVARGINATVQSIGSNVSSIGASVASIGGSVASIHGRVATIEGVVGPTGAQDGSINANVTRIHDNLGTTLGRVVSIRDGVVAINGRADTIIGLSKALHGDLSSVFSIVGSGLRTATILGHANSIDCARLINLLGRTQSCGK
jgi:methyl-accepting chemotaxis protein